MIGSKSVYDFLDFVYCFIVYCGSVLSLALRDIFHTPMARYSLLVQKVPLNTEPNQTTYLCLAYLDRKTCRHVSQISKITFYGHRWLR